MRIDYSEPKKSCSSPQPSQSRPRRESSGGVFIIVSVTALLCFGIGFGSGWMLSQRSAKKGFQAALAQQSFESSPQQIKAQPPQPQPPPAASSPQPAGAQAPQTAATMPVPASTSGGQSAPAPPLSFYKSLPSGQKNNVMGSGINSKEDKPAKQLLQAAMPTNMNKPAAPAGEENTQKQPAQAAQAKPVRPDSSGLTVQVASYSLKSEAETMRGKLAAKGYNVSIVESHLADKGIWYRVRVGRHLDADAAKELAAKIGKGAIAIPDKD